MPSSWYCHGPQQRASIQRFRLTSVATLFVKMRRSRYHIIHIMEIPIHWINVFILLKQTLFARRDFGEKITADRSQVIFWHNTHLNHWGRVTHICVGNLAIIGPDNGLSPGRHQTIIYTKDGILLIGPLRTNFSEILIEIVTFSFKKMRLKVSSAKRQPFCFGLNVLR